MQIKSKHLLTMLVMAGISATAISAKAATFAAGDLLLAFNQTSGIGSGTVLTVDLGQASQFVNAHTNSTNIANVASLGSIINSTYGTGALSTGDSTVLWTVAGDNTTGTVHADSGVSDANHNAYITVAQDGNTINNFGQVTSNFTSGTTLRAGYASQIGSVATSFASATGTTGPIAVASTNTAWATNAAGSWGNGNIVVQGGFGSGPSGTALDLYRVFNGTSTPSGTTGSSQYLGTFSINSSGVVSFNTTVASAPEPSRTLFAALGLGGLLLRRRRVNA